MRISVQVELRISRNSKLETRMYSEKVKINVKAAAARGRVLDANASGRAVSFLCGVSIEFDLFVNNEEKEIEKAGFRTNGCGYTVAAAEFLAGSVEGKKLTELAALVAFEQALKKEFGPIPDNRHHCFNICLDALQNAFADFRRRQIVEWHGDEVLICSCFGVSESRIENAVSGRGLRSVEEVGGECNAGTGCGSCQPLIQEILDNLTR